MGIVVHLDHQFCWGAINGRHMLTSNRRSENTPCFHVSESVRGLFFMGNTLTDRYRCNMCNIYDQIYCICKAIITF